MGEELRPRFHYTPARNWMNDPNGLIFRDGEYHIYYQYNPDGAQWGHMSWGHAVSTDLLTWHEQPVAIPEADHMIFSGSAVRTKERFGEDTICAFYTAHFEYPRRQCQHLALSTDRGRSFTSFAENPVIDEEMEDFRDPKVFFHPASGRWVMVLARSREHVVSIYTSEDLTQWRLASNFHEPGLDSGQWECPDLLEVPTLDNAQSHWVLKIDIDQGVVGSGSGAVYFIGDFDGQTFTPFEKTPMLADYGTDFYAAASFSDLPASHSHPLWIAWHSNHQNARFHPTDPWRGAQSLPRELFLFEEAGRWRLGQRPIGSLSDRMRPSIGLQDASTGKTFRIQTVIDAECQKPSGVLLEDGAGSTILIGFDPAKGTVFVDRSRVGRDWPNFAIRCDTDRIPAGPVSLDFWGDGACASVFVNGGKRALSFCMFPEGQLRAGLFGDGADAGQLALPYD